jgi:hypothetical protein
MRKNFSKARNLMALNLVLILGFGLIGLNLFHSTVHAGGEECAPRLTVMSGNGIVGGTDSQVQVDSGSGFNPANIVSPFVLGQFSWSKIPGTEWVSPNPDRSGTPFSDFAYRTNFVLPECFSVPSLTILVHSDNVATIFLNGNQIGMQPDIVPNGDVANFQDPAESFTTSNAGFFLPGNNVLSFTVHNYADQTGLDFKADICFTDCVVTGCGTCDNGVVIVDQNTTVDLNPAVPTCTGDPDLCPYFSFDKSGPSPSTWKAKFNVGAKKLLVTNGATITVVPGPPNGGNNKEAPGIEIRSTCEVQIDQGAAVVVQSINRQAGDIFIQADGNVTINGTVSDSVTGTNGRPGDITIVSCCGNILTGPKSLIQTIGVDHGGSDINLLACSGGNITINGLVDASYKGESAATINIAAFGGAVTIDGNNFQGIEAGTQRPITSGVTVRSRRDPLAGKIFIQALNDITVLGNRILDKNHPNYGAVAVKPTSTNGSSGAGIIQGLSVGGKIVASDRAFDIANRFNGLNAIQLLANGNIDLSVTAAIDNGAVNNTKAVVNSQGGSAGKGGTNGLRSVFGGITIGPNAQVLANFVGTPGSNGANFLVSCLGVTNNGTVAPADGVPGDDSGACAGPAPSPLFTGCDQFNAGCGKQRGGN